jgi:hypothetical protein
MPITLERYRIDAQRSLVLILIYRDGRMAALGHNHVIAVRELSGDIVLAADVTQSSWQLDFPVAALSVDEPQLRAAQGADFQSAVDQVAIAGTRDHMLGPALLDAASFPTIHLQSLQLQPHSDAARSDGEDLLMTIRILVRDHSAELQLPVSLQRSGDELVASGEFDLTHAQLGLTPYSVALGALSPGGAARRTDALKMTCQPDAGTSSSSVPSGALSSALWARSSPRGNCPDRAIPSARRRAISSAMSAHSKTSSGASAVRG